MGIGGIVAGIAPVTREIEPWDGLLARGRADDRLVTTSAEHGREPRVATLPPDLHPTVADALRGRGIDGLWSHQAAAWDAVADGSVIVTTGTASGKSLAFNLPVLDTLHRDGLARALYLYPAKALAQDQARALHAFGLDRVRPAIYDGDTPQAQRAAIRRQSNLVLSNPDMLHVGILPRHEAWAGFLRNLAVVVVDEAHVYRGVFGSHVANVLRRLRRACRAYGADPRFILASATIANPVELAERLTGLDDFTLVDEDGSPGARRTVAMWNPPVTDEKLQTRRSALAEAAELLAELVDEGARTICFMKSRRGVELLSRLCADALTERGRPDLAARVAPYRAGYTAAQRRALEQRLVDGDLLGVVATSALELGIDIGALDAALVVTFPGTVASLRQMWGRAGRRGRGLALYMAGEDGLDQYFCRHPDTFLDRPVEAAILDHENEQIYGGHLLCAAHEGPLDADDAATLGPDWEWHARRLVTAGRLHRDRHGRYVPRHPETYPAGDVSLRSGDARAFAVADAETGEVLGTVEAARAFTTVHDGAIYLHQGRSYEVQALDLDHDAAVVAPFSGDWYTQPKTESMTEILRVLDEREQLGVTLRFGEVRVTETVLAYQRKRLADHEQIDLVGLDLPETSFVTQALWYELPDATLGGELPIDVLLGSLHASEHAQIAVLPLLAMCDRWDIGGLSTNYHPQTGRPTVFIYDGHPGGIGITRRGYLAFDALVEAAHRLVGECRCEDGCPSCVQSPKCGNLNEYLHKSGAVTLMGRMLAST